VTQNTLRALFLASWYPSDENPLLGIFIKRHAEAVSEYCDVAVLHIQFSPRGTSSGLQYAVEDGIKTVRASVRVREAHFKNSVCASLERMVAFIRFLFCSRRALKLALRELGSPDVVHVNHMSIVAIIALYLNLTKGIPFVLSEHSSSFKKDVSSTFSRNLTKMVLARASSVMPVSAYLRDQMQTLYTNANYKIVPNVVDTRKFRPSARQKKPPFKKQILHVSLLRDIQKNVSGILEAAEQLSRRRQDFEVFIVGEGNDRQRLERHARDLGVLNSFVHFEGRVSENELVNRLQRSDFFVLNSNVETFAVVCAEALACGLPVISTRCGGPEDYITEDVGILTEPRDTDALIQAMEFMLENSQQFDPRKLHDYIKSKFSYEVVGKELFSQYKAAVNAN
jgi:glycosyltransferase involved in cell wall biosynthesis